LVKKDPERTAESIDKVEKMARACLAEVRRAVAALRTSPLDASSLNDALKELIDDFNNSGVVASLEIEGDASTISTPVKTALYRAVQEGLTNVAKHANASVVKVKLEYGDEAVDLSIMDNGVGMHGNGQSGYGIEGLRERAAILGGSVEAGDAPDGGYCLAVHLPLNLDLNLGMEKDG
jgi:signal transduction histidine kinase